MEKQNGHEIGWMRGFNEGEYVVMGVGKVISGDASKWEALVYCKSQLNFLLVEEKHSGGGLSEVSLTEKAALKWLEDKGPEVKGTRTSRYLSQSFPLENRPDTERLKVIQARRDHAVVKDFSSARGYKFMSLEDLKQHPHKSKTFIGTKVECQKWVEAQDAEARFEVELWAMLRHKTRVPLPSEAKKADDLKASVQKMSQKFEVGQQGSLFNGPDQGSPPKDKQQKL